MMTAERRPRSGSSRKGKGILRVGHGFADEAKQRTRIRGNTGDPSFLRSPGPECGRRLPLVNPDTGKINTYLPSEPWVDVHFYEISDVSPDGEEIVVRYYEKRAKDSPLNAIPDRKPMSAAQRREQVDRLMLRGFTRKEAEATLPKTAVGAHRCPTCGRICPLPAVEGDRCMCHRPQRVQKKYGRSRSATAIERWRLMNEPRRLRNEPPQRIEETPLPSETPADLRAEIRRYEQTGILPE